MGIVTQPQSQSAALRTTVTFTVKATGENLKYQRQFKRLGTEAWVNSTASSANQASAIAVMTEARNGQSYWRAVTDGSGKSVISNVAYFRMQ